MALTVRVEIGTPHRIEAPCPGCGWDDVWEVAMLRLTPHGVTTFGYSRRCARCRTTLVLRPS